MASKLLKEGKFAEQFVNSDTDTTYLAILKHIEEMFTIYAVFYFIRITGTLTEIFNCGANFLQFINLRCLLEC